MGEINFLANDNSEDDKEKEKKKNKSSIADKNNGQQPDHSLGTPKTEEGRNGNKERIKKSRQEVLEIIDKSKKKEKKKDKSKLEPKKEKPSEKHSSWMTGIFGKTKHQKENPQGQKNEKIKEKPKKDFQQEKTLVKEKGSKPRDKQEEKTKIAKDSPLMFSENTWNSSGVLETNLIDKSEISFFDSGKKLKYIFISVLGSLCVVGALYVGVLFWEHMELSKLKIKKTKIENLNTEVKKLEKDISEAKAFQKRLDMAGDLLQHHVYFTNFLNFLEEKTLSKVYYSGDLKMAISPDVDLSIRVPDYATLKNQLIVFANDSRVVDVSNKKDISVYEDTFKYQAATDEELKNLIASGLTPEEAKATTTKTIKETGLETSLELTIDDKIFFDTETVSSSTGNKLN